MKKLTLYTLLSLPLLAVSLVGLVFTTACGEKAETTTSSVSSTTTVVISTTTTSAPSAGDQNTTTTGLQPVTGGKMRCIIAALPSVLGYYPETGPRDQTGLTPGMERLMEMNADRELVPKLAEKVEEDPDGLTITIQLRKGVKFHDGTELTAEVAKWNLDLYKQTGKLMWGSCVDSFDVTGPYTVVARLNKWNNQVMRCLVDAPMFSKEATEKNGVEWAKANFVGTGPFVVKEFNRDQNLVWVRNPDYWGKDQGLPYLDEVEFIYLSDMNTAKAAMEAKEADVWGVGAIDAQMLSEMKQKGYPIQAGWAGGFSCLVPNLADETSPLHDQRVREAVEYAIDKETISDALGYGFGSPLYEVAPHGEWGEGAAKIQRKYNPEKAKQLLAEAGYPNGCPVELLAQIEAGGRNATAEAIKGYLDAAGFVTTLDIADVGRFFGSAYGTGWKDLLLSGSGNNYQYYLMDLLNFWSQYNVSFVPWAKWTAPPELAQLFDEAVQLRDLDAMKAKTEEIVAYFADKALVIPIMDMTVGAVVQPWVHTNYPLAGLITWDWAHSWVEPH